MAFRRWRGAACRSWPKRKARGAAPAPRKGPRGPRVPFFWALRAILAPAPPAADVVDPNRYPRTREVRQSVRVFNSNIVREFVGYRTILYTIAGGGQHTPML